jgi:TolB protein
MPFLTVLLLTQSAQPLRVTHVTNAYGAFGPAGHTIAYQSNDGGNYDLYTVDLRTVQRRRIVSSSSDDITPVFSPDGKKIAFVSERHGDRDVFVCNADGTAQKRLTNWRGNEIHPTWSSDGKRLMFSGNKRNKDPEDFDIYVMNADGSRVRRITSGPDVDTYSSWSPDGKLIVTRRVVAGNSEVFLLNADGSGARNLTNSPNYDGWPTFSPDGKKIVFSTGVESDPAGLKANTRVHLMNLDGSGKQAITSPPPGDDWVYDTQPAFSRDGKRIVFTRYRHGIPGIESADICVLSVKH